MSFENKIVVNYLLERRLPLVDTDYFCIVSCKLFGKDGTAKG